MMVVVVAGYLTLDQPSPAISILFTALFVASVMEAVGSPTRWSVSITVRLHQAMPVLAGVTAVGIGSYKLYTTDAWVYSGVLLSFGVLMLVGFHLADWGEVAAYFEQLNASGAEATEAWPPLPRRQFLKLRYAVNGIVAVSTAIVLARLLYRPDLGVFVLLAGIGGAGLLNVWCSPCSGPPERIVRFRQARWAVLAVGLGASSLYGLVEGNVTVLAAVFGFAAGGLAYWAVAVVSWEEVRESIAAEQTDSGSIDD